MKKSYYKKYYNTHKEDRIEYQTVYNMIHAESIKEYQRKYYQENKRIIYNQRLKRKGKVPKVSTPKEYKPLPEYKLQNLERMLRKKLKHINSIILSENPSKLLTQNGESGITPLRSHPNKYQAKKLLKKYQYSLEQIQPFSEFVITNEGFTLSFN